MNRLLEFVGLVMFMWLLVLFFCWAGAHAAVPRHARVSHRYVCAQAYKGAQLPATRRNIMRGVCVVAG